MTYYFARRKFFYLQLCLCFDIFSSCSTYKHATQSYYKPPNSCITYEEWSLYDQHQAQAASHWLYHLIPRHRSQIRWFDVGHWVTWGLFGNDDDGIFGEANVPLFRPDKNASLGKGIAWMLRNPLHNFCFYVIGNAGAPTDEWTLLKINSKKVEFFTYKHQADTVFAGRYSSFFLGLHNGLPLISLRVAYGHFWKSDFYIGWRERGNFGIKFLPLTKVSYATWDCYEDEK